MIIKINKIKHNTVHYVINSKITLYLRHKIFSLQHDHMLLPKFLVRRRSLWKVNKLGKPSVLMHCLDNFYMKFCHIFR
jgi:hypothetical protein